MITREFFFFLSNTIHESVHPWHIHFVHRSLSKREWESRRKVLLLSATMYNYLKPFQMRKSYEGNGCKIYSLPIFRKRNPPITVRILRVVRSPKDAAMGVAILSGLIRHLFDKTITIIIIVANMNEAIAAVETLALHRTSACRRLKYPCGIQPITRETTAASDPTTIACNCIKTIFPIIILFNSFLFSIFPIFAYDQLDP